MHDACATRVVGAAGRAHAYGERRCAAHRASSSDERGRVRTLREPPLRCGACSPRSRSWACAYMACSAAQRERGQRARGSKARGGTRAQPTALQATPQTTNITGHTVGPRLLSRFAAAAGRQRRHRPRHAGCAARDGARSRRRVVATRASLRCRTTRCGGTRDLAHDTHHLHVYIIIIVDIVTVAAVPPATGVGVAVPAARPGARGITSSFWSRTCAAYARAAALAASRRQHRRRASCRCDTRVAARARTGTAVNGCRASAPRCACTSPAHLDGQRPQHRRASRRRVLNDGGSRG